MTCLLSSPKLLCTAGQERVALEMKERWPKILLPGPQGKASCYYILVTSDDILTLPVTFTTTLILLAKVWNLDSLSEERW